MKYYYTIPLLAACAVPVVKAQSLSDLPACAQQAGLSSITATGCPVTDISCICNSVPFLQTLRAYITSHCDPSDQAGALTFAQTLCATVGINIPAEVMTSSSAVDTMPSTSFSGTSTTTIMPMSTDTSMAPTASPMSSMATASPTTMETMEATSSVSTMSSMMSASTSDMGAGPSSAAPASFTGGAAVFGQQWTLALGGVAGAIAAVL